ncbi:hypothetical protein D3C72_2225050 [compost metagenome]
MFGDGGKIQFALPQQVLGDRHAPDEQILHRWHADGAREALEEDGAGQCGLVRQLRHGPGMGGIGVDLANGHRQPRISQPAQQAGCRALPFN